MKNIWIDINWLKEKSEKILKYYKSIVKESKKVIFDDSKQKQEMFQQFENIKNTLAIPFKEILDEHNKIKKIIAENYYETQDNIDFNNAFDEYEENLNLLKTISLKYWLFDFSLKSWYELKRLIDPKEFRLVINSLWVEIFRKLYEKDKNITISPLFIYFSLIVSYNFANFTEKENLEKIFLISWIELNYLNYLFKESYQKMLNDVDYEKSLKWVNFFVWQNSDVLYWDFMNDIVSVLNKNFFYFSDINSISNYLKDNFEFIQKLEIENIKTLIYIKFNISSNFWNDLWFNTKEIKEFNNLNWDKISTTFIGKKDSLNLLYDDDKELIAYWIKNAFKKNSLMLITYKKWTILELVNWLNFNRIKKIKSRLREKKIDIYFPIFSLEQESELSDVFKYVWYKDFENKKFYFSNNFSITENIEIKETFKPTFNIINIWLQKLWIWYETKSIIFNKPFVYILYNENAIFNIWVINNIVSK